MYEQDHYIFPATTVVLKIKNDVLSRHYFIIHPTIHQFSYGFMLYALTLLLTVGAGFFVLVFI